MYHLLFKYFVRFIPKKSDYECLSFAKEDWVPSEKILIFEIHNEYNFTTLKRDAEYNLSFTNITTSSFELSHHINDQDRVLSFKELTLVLNDRIITK